MKIQGRIITAAFPQEVGGAECRLVRLTPRSEHISLLMRAAHCCAVKSSKSGRGPSLGAATSKASIRSLRFIGYPFSSAHDDDCHHLDHSRWSTSSVVAIFVLQATLLFPASPRSRCLAWPDATFLINERIREIAARAIRRTLQSMPLRAAWGTIPDSKCELIAALRCPFGSVRCAASRRPLSG